MQWSTTDGRIVAFGICWKCREQTACTCNRSYSASGEMIDVDDLWEEQCALANEGMADYARMLRELDQDDGT